MKNLQTWWEMPSSLSSLSLSAWWFTSIEPHILAEFAPYCTTSNINTTTIFLILKRCLPKVTCWARIISSSSSKGVSRSRSGWRRRHFHFENKLIFNSFLSLFSFVFVFVFVYVCLSLCHSFPCLSVYISLHLSLYLFLCQYLLLLSTPICLFLPLLSPHSLLNSCPHSLFSSSPSLQKMTVVKWLLGN